MRAEARRTFEAAVTAADPARFLEGRLPLPAKGRVFLIGAGKAAVGMIQAAESFYLDQCRLDPQRLAGLAVTRHGYGGRTRAIPVIEAGHPVPDIFGIDGTERLLNLADETQRGDIAVVLMSGGGSANLIAPAGEVTLAEKQALTSALLRSGAPIDAINCVRKHVSRVKGGRLAARLAPARVVTLAISDVPGDDPSVIGSGPTVPDMTTLADARAVIERYGIMPPASVADALNDPGNETPKPGDPAFEGATFEIVGRPADALAAAVAQAAALGYAVTDLGADVAGEARDVAARHALMALSLKRAGRKAAILSGGELTVTLRGKGRGGPNQEYALALALALNGESGIVALACDTDGTDGGQGLASDPAGALVDSRTLTRARSNGVDAAACLADNDSTRFFAAAGDLVITGPTRTNANDLRVLLIDPQAAG
ncbi:MAG TPA: glycerate kinase [Beijerinckiaceae bacterium]|nr:glycerate kinase [Beijerinckiaceae bacterium]